MRTFLAWWITLQLLAIGLAAGAIENQMSTGTYKCVIKYDGTGIVPMISSVSFPLLLFMNAPSHWTEYCNKQQLKDL